MFYTTMVSLKIFFHKRWICLIVIKFINWDPVHILFKAVRSIAMALKILIALGFHHVIKANLMAKGAF